MVVVVTVVVVWQWTVVVVVDGGVVTVVAVPSECDRVDDYECRLMFRERTYIGTEDFGLQFRNQKGKEKKRIVMKNGLVLWCPGNKCLYNSLSIKNGYNLMWLSGSVKCAL